MTSQDARRLRRRAKIKQTEVAERIGLTRTAYEAWENGRRGLAFDRTVLEVFEAIRALASEKGTAE